MSRLPPLPQNVEVISEEVVTQAALADESVTLHKQHLRVDGRLAVVRKFTVAGPKVVLVHGFAQNRYSWHSTNRSLSTWLAARGYDVYNLELRGHGNSRASQVPEHFHDYVDDAVVVANALSEPAFWIGHSLGGGVSYAAATKVPARGVIGLGALYQFAQANRTLHWLCRASTLVRGRRFLGNVSVRTRLAGTLLSKLYGISDIAGYAFPISGWAPESIEPQILAERLERGFDWTSLHVWLDMANMGASGEFEYDEAWGRTDVPLLVIGGDLDHLMPPADARTAYDRSGSSDKSWMLLDDWTTGLHWGHLDLIIGRHAPDTVWKPLHAWMNAR